jgi:CheY-specific phosphatase CheX
MYPMITIQNTLLKTGALIIGFTEKLDVTLVSQLQEITETSDLEDLVTSTLTTKNNFSGQNSFFNVL